MCHNCPGVFAHRVSERLSSTRVFAFLDHKVCDNNPPGIFANVDFVVCFHCCVIIICFCRLIQQVVVASIHWRAIHRLLLFMLLLLHWRAVHLLILLLLLLLLLHWRAVHRIMLLLILLLLFHWRAVHWIMLLLILLLLLHWRAVHWISAYFSCCINARHIDE
jgi:hypothetical protein